MMTTRPLAVLVTASAISFVGSTLTRVALPWFVLQTTGSATQTGLVGAAGLLPAFVSGVLGGAAVDVFGFSTALLALACPLVLVAASQPFLPVLHDLDRTGPPLRQAI